MKIKIPAQTSREITQEAVNRDVIPKSQNGTELETTNSNNFIGIVEHKNGERRVYQTLSIEQEGKFYLSALPSPTHLYLTTALELFEMSEQKKSINFITCGKQSNNSNLYLLDFDPGDTHECYTDYLKARISSIIMLVSTLENFMNQIIPNDFVYSKTVKDQMKEFNHKKIEDNLSFMEKLQFVVPLAINQIDFWDNRIQELETLTELYKNRKEFIHLKTKSEEEWKRYSDVFSQMLKFDILNALNTSIEIMNAIENNFIEFGE